MTMQQELLSDTVQVTIRDTIQAPQPDPASGRWNIVRGPHEGSGAICQHHDKQLENHHSLYWKLKRVIRLSFKRSPTNRTCQNYQEPRTFEANKHKLNQRDEKNDYLTSSHQIIKNKQSDDRDETENGELDVDSGYAWIILAIMFLINASTFGTARANGLIFDKQARQAGISRSMAALPFTIMGAVENMSGPITSYLLARTKSWRLTMVVGSSLIASAHLLSALFDSIVGQTLAMGLMCGLGLSFVTISSFQINNAYFVRYRSRAFGLCLTGGAAGTFYISPVSQYVLDNYSISLCYLILGLILLPNVPLSLLLRPKKTTNTRAAQIAKPYVDQPPGAFYKKEREAAHGEVVSELSKGTISGRLAANDSISRTLWENILLVIKCPIFHLIWPTQLLFCWFNFVFGMIIVDFGEDRGLKGDQVLINIWAMGQLAGRLGLGSLVDMKFISFRLFTVICFASISLSTWALNQIHSTEHEQLLLFILVFTLSMFISNLYILFNDLVESYMDKSLTSLSIGISSFTGSFFLLPRASIIGHYRDTIGNYDDMITVFSYISMGAALTWFIAPELCYKIKLICNKFRRGKDQQRLHLPPPIINNHAIIKEGL